MVYRLSSDKVLGIIIRRIFESQRSFLDIFVRLHSQDAIHDSVTIDIGDSTGSRLRIVVLNNGSVKIPSEIVLLDEALLQGSLSCE
jgi:hypothetical protein